MKIGNWDETRRFERVMPSGCTLVVILYCNQGWADSHMYKWLAFPDSKKAEKKLDCIAQGWNYLYPQNAMDDAVSWYKEGIIPMENRKPEWPAHLVTWRWE